MMSKMPQSPKVTTCPRCGDGPLDAGDNFCGACGAALPAAAAAAPAPDSWEDGASGRPRSGPEGIAAARPQTPPGTAVPDTRLPHDSEGGIAVPPVPAHPPTVPPPGHERSPLPPPDPDTRLAPGPQAGPAVPPGREHTDDYLLAPADPRTAVAYGVGEPGRTVTGTPGGTEATGHTENPAAPAGPEDSPDGFGTACVACRAGAIDPDGYCENCGHAQPRRRDHLEEHLGCVAAVSDRGLRHHRNEDAFAVSEIPMPGGPAAVVAVVCDGVSSAARPDEASQAASAAASESLLTSLPGGVHPQQAMQDAILAAAQAVNSLANAEQTDEEHDSHQYQNAPACTIVSAVVTSGTLTIGWIGDSRAYWVPDDRTDSAVRLTEDDSWAAQMVAAGMLSEAEAYADQRAHAITGWLGADAHEIQPHTTCIRPERPGVVVVCTDGLWNYAETTEDMARAVPADARARPLHSARALVGYALDGGGHDNVTVAVVPFPGPAQGAESA